MPALPFGLGFEPWELPPLPALLRRPWEEMQSRAPSGSHALQEMLPMPSPSARGDRVAALRAAGTGMTAGAALALLAVVFLRRTRRQGTRDAVSHGVVYPLGPGRLAVAL